MSDSKNKEMGVVDRAWEATKATGRLVFEDTPEYMYQTVREEKHHDAHAKTEAALAAALKDGDQAGVGGQVVGVPFMVLTGLSGVMTGLARNATDPAECPLTPPHHKPNGKGASK